MLKRILSKYSVCYGCNITYHIVYFSPARDLPPPSLSEGSSLPPEMAENETPPRAPSPIAVDNTEVLSRRTSPGHGGASEAAEKAPEDNTSAAEDMEGATPMATDDGGPEQSGPQPDIIPETNVAPESGEQPPSKEEGASAPTAASTNPEASNTLVEALLCAAIVEEHRTLMGVVIEKVQSA